METVSPLRMLFVHIGHLFYCLSLLAVASVEWKFHQDLGMHWLVLPVSYMLAGLTFGFLVWSIVEGLKRLLGEKRWIPAAMLGGIYLSVFTLAAMFFPTLVLRK
jgi:hypothetical protein